jgi:hypothetical protein
MLLALRFGLKTALAFRASLNQTSHSLNHRNLFLAHDSFERLS